jgi:alpha-beta hydrolase superfamily lysophospholipase
MKPSSLHVPRGFPVYDGSRSGVELDVATPHGKTHLWVETFVLEENSDKPVLLVVHGQGEHSGRYQHFPHYLKGRYSRMVFFDLPGHGKTSGTRGYVPEFAVFYEAVSAVYEYLLRFNPKAVHLFGHSLGGLIALGLKRHLFRPPRLASRCRFRP